MVMFLSDELTWFLLFLVFSICAMGCCIFAILDTYFEHKLEFTLNRNKLYVHVCKEALRDQIYYLEKNEFWKESSKLKWAKYKCTLDELNKNFKE